VKICQSTALTSSMAGSEEVRHFREATNATEASQEFLLPLTPGCASGSDDNPRSISRTVSRSTSISSQIGEVVSMSKSTCSSWTARIGTLSLLLAFLGVFSSLRRAALVTPAQSSEASSGHASVSLEDMKLHVLQQYVDSMSNAQPAQVEIKCSADQCKVMSDGKALGVGKSLRGVAGWNYYQDAKSRGAEVVRTWSLDSALDNAMFQAKLAGLKVSIGIDIPHEKYRYEGEFCNLWHPYWVGEWNRVSSYVMKYRNSQETLWWTVGNELESFIQWSDGSPCLWKRVQWFVQKVKAMDHNHPVGTVLAGFHPNKVRSINRYIPSLDFLGINMYGSDSFDIGKYLLRAGFDKPYSITEYGVPGNWMVPQTPWGANVEPITSTAKREWFAQTFRWCEEDPHCVGSFAFDWGWKWEKTATWFGFYNEWRDTGLSWQHGIINDAGDALFTAWNSSWDDGFNLAIKKVTVLGKNGREVPKLGFSAPRGATVQVDIELETTRPKKKPKPEAALPTGRLRSEAKQATRATVGAEGSRENSAESRKENSSSEDSDENRRHGSEENRTHEQIHRLLGEADESDESPISEVVWRVARDVSASNMNGNLQEKALHAIPNKVKSCATHDDAKAGLRGLIQTSELYPGMYRLYAFVRMGRKEEPAGCETSRVGDACWYGMQWVKETGLPAHPEWYPDLSPTSSDRDFQIHLAKTGNQKCRMPCDKEGSAKELVLSMPFRVCDRMPCDRCTDASSASLSNSNNCYWAVSKQILDSKQSGVALGLVRGVLPNSSFAEFQSLMHRRNAAGCPPPCATEASFEMQGSCSDDR